MISELDVANALRRRAAPAYEIVSLADRPELAPAVYVIACESYVDQPGREDQRMPPFEEWRLWGLDPHPAEAYLIALENGEPIGYGYLELGAERATHGFMAVARTARGRGVAGALKQAQIAWAKAHGVTALRTATETRLTRMRALNARHGYRPSTTRSSSAARPNRPTSRKDRAYAPDQACPSRGPVYSVATWASSRSSCWLQLWHC